MSVSSGWLLEPATGFAGSSMIMALLLGFVYAFAASDNQSSSVYCSNVPDDGAVVDSTALTGHGGGHVTCLAAACFATLFHVLPEMAFSDGLLANSSITSVTHSEVSPALLLSQWRTFSSSSVPSGMKGHVVGALNRIQPSLLFGSLYWLSISMSYIPGALNVSQNLILKAWAMPFGVTFRYHSQKSTSGRFRVLSGSCLTAGGHVALFINQVCIMLVNYFVIPGCITNGAGLEAWACAFSCFRARDMIMCSSGVRSVPFFALAISRASLNSGLLREHVCCHMFPPAHVFPSGLCNTPVTKIVGSPFPHGGVILNVGGCTGGSVVWDPTACDNDASIIGIGSSASTDILALLGKKPL